MEKHELRRVDVAGTYNLRDLGGFETPRGQIQWRRLFRSDGLHRVDETGVAKIVSIGVRTVIDLRDPAESAVQPNPVAQADGVAYHNRPLWKTLAVHTHVGTDPLSSLYRMALDEHTHLLVDILRLIAEAPEGAVLFHCTAGKDRTGLVAALVLSLLDVDPVHIADDYSRTAELIAPMSEKYLADLVERGNDRQAILPFLASDPQTMLDTLDYLQRRYGSVRKYLSDAGLSAETQQRLVTRLVEC